QWTQDDIDVMKNWGNGKVNALYMPNPERHPPPTSMEGSAMEQYIRSKYERKEFMEGGGNYKPSSRSAYGNTFSGGRGGPSNDIVNTQTYTTQMSALRGMGFTDNAKNIQVLQSTNGDVPNAIEILCRIGSGPVTSSANLLSSSNSSSPSRGAARRTPSSNNLNKSNGAMDPKEAKLWDMGFRDSALNKEALRRAGGNPEVAAGILIDDKEKLAKAVRDKSSSSPLPSRLDPPNSSKNQKNEALLLDLSDDTSQEQQNQRNQLLQQQQMLQQMQMQNAFGNTNQQMFSNNDQFGQNHNQLQSILERNANILALYSNDTNNQNNGMNMNNAFGLQQQQAGNMNNAFGLQQQQNTGNVDMSSWVPNNNNNLAMGSAFGINTSMPSANTGNNMFGSVNNNNAMGMGMNMGSIQQPNNPFSQGLSNNNNNNAFGTITSQSTGMPGNNQFATNNNNNQFNNMNQMGSSMSPFNTNTLSSNNNAFMSGTSQAMNPMGGMGQNNNSNFNSAFGMNPNNNNNNNFNNFNAHNNNNPWGNNNLF
ncbi:hypothetical protein BGZ46_009472, partial [Entomortierella lignicola]